MDHEQIDPGTIGADLGTRLIPRTIEYHTSVGSTMDLARDLLRRLDDSQLPALVVADEQTAGRGRLGRPWIAPPGSALLASLVLRPTWLAPDQGVALVWLTAVALCEAIEQVTPLQPALKWPNDVLVAARSYSHATDAQFALPDEQAPQALTAPDQGTAPPEPNWAKAAGILLEVTLGLEGIEAAVIGCGVNISAAPPPAATLYPATSLAEATGAPVSRLAVLRAFLRRLDTWHDALQSGGGDALFAAWRSRLITLGQQVRITTPGGVIEGRAETVERSGALIVRDAAGLPHAVTAGDVGLTP